MEVSDHEIGVVGLPVEGRERDHDAGQAAKDEDRQRPGDEQHRHPIDHPAGQERR